ncbi:MAG: class I SAM-dependent methyltransferase [Acidobacteria bacterium]|nr:class I SAM-dependent methyltransferase [Acidobacteriota bacterium]
MALLYDRQFFDEIQPGTSRSAAKVVPELIQLISPASVVDVGCGRGAWVAEFQRHGVTDVLGLDGDWVGRHHLSIQPELFLARDLKNPLSLNRKFDLAITLEVAEHLPPERGESFVSDLVDLAPVILFSAAIPDSGGVGHVNERWPDYWAEIFAKFDYIPFDYLRFKFWDDPQIEWWYRQNMILYIQRDYLKVHTRLKAILDRKPPKVLRLVHPDYHMEKITDFLVPGVRRLLRALPGATIRMIKQRLSWLMGNRSSSGRFSRSKR